MPSAVPVVSTSQQARARSPSPAVDTPDVDEPIAIAIATPSPPKTTPRYRRDRMCSSESSAEDSEQEYVPSENGSVISSSDESEDEGPVVMPVRQAVPRDDAGDAAGHPDDSAEDTMDSDAPLADVAAAAVAAVAARGRGSFMQDAPGMPGFVWRDEDCTPEKFRFDGLPGVKDQDVDAYSTPLDLFRAFSTPEMTRRIVEETNR